MLLNTAEAPYPLSRFGAGIPDAKGASATGRTRWGGVGRHPPEADAIGP